MSRSGRPLTAAEVTLSRRVFGDAIAYDRVRLFNRRWWPFQPAKTVMAPDGNLWFAPSNQMYCDDFCTREALDQGVFIHEMTHVWQQQHGVFLPLRRHPFCRYSYEYVPGKPFARYGIEQQAEIVRHYFLTGLGWRLSGKPDHATYAALVPFASLA